MTRRKDRGAPYALWEFDYLFLEATRLARTHQCFAEREGSRF